ncbi:p74 [Erannis ankeraria nucleopolyhedrovirus]|uniref:p74 n=1 Tax=Erannis ankeraria nucleopolyhedrovirus TaxID=2913600 RepID=UPI002481F5AF|nr:p74 [Erannis ankeraria nucleopolyhedrovirus]UJZ88964.1 p74 [Erannis ankeraria nucleopolyhedrovirus]
MATLTTTDLTNASRYATHQHRLQLIPKWRSKLPHILLNYEIRPATNDDFYVPSSLKNKAVAVNLNFSERGCNSMSCYPFNETGPIDYNTPFGNTQTSDITVAYAQPACYHLDRAAATREGAENEIQSAELRYTDTGHCILVDTLSKMYMNSPYLRTDEHLIQGVDDVPGFNVIPNRDSLFPEMFEGEFNEAYCRRFGRQLNSGGGCSMQWWESLIGFVLGDTIYVTFKLLANNIFSELRNFDYTRPSPMLPPRPTVNSEEILNNWRTVRDTFVDFEFEQKFIDYTTLQDLTIDDNTKLIYTAEKGFTREPFIRNLQFRQLKYSGYDNVSDKFTVSEDDLNFIISQFLEDYSLIMGIWVSFGFDNVLDAMKAMLKQINSALIPAMKRMLLTTGKRVTVRMLGETYKAAIVHQFNLIAIKTISAVAKSLTRMAIQAASVIGILLILLTLTDLVLALWDPFGYSNMFPREFTQDLSNSFLTAHFESLNETRDMLVIKPEFFSDIVELDNETLFESLYHILDYVSALEVNSNGQMLHFEESEKIDDFDEVTLVGSALASSSLYTKLDFLQYTQRHNDILYTKNDSVTNTLMGVLWGVAAFVILLNRNNDYKWTILFFVFLLLAVYMLLNNPINYYIKLRKTIPMAETEWYKNLYI